MRDLAARGYKEVTLLGQNVNSYRGRHNGTEEVDFAALLRLVARAVPEMRIRFSTSHPKDMGDETLRVIGRAHTAQQTINAFNLAREMGIHHINMDLIAALPGETEADFARSLEKTIALSPESVTVHTLAIKRSSRLHEENRYRADADAAARMVTYARETLGGALYRPYYLYRQKYMAGNLENVGYARTERI